MGMDINQIIELWRDLSPRLARGIPDQELLEDEHIDEKKSHEDDEEAVKKKTMLGKETILNAY
jgi:hypothetical protein